MFWKKHEFALEDGTRVGIRASFQVKRMGNRDGGRTFS